MQNIILKSTATAATSIALLLSTSALASPNTDIQALRLEVQQMRQAYEARIVELESKIEKLENNHTAIKGMRPSSTATTTQQAQSNSRQVYNNDFNPSIGVILNGKFSNFSENTSEIKGFGIGEEGERGREGLAVDESELNFSASVDDKFKGSLTAAIVREDGEDKIELEEAYVQTLPGSGLPDGLSIKAGRAFWTLGYMNEHHSHTDDFADRPLPHRVYLNKSFNDDGVEASYVLPTPFYSEVGGGLFRGDDYPAGSSDGEGASSYSVFARVGGDIGANQSWRVGGSLLLSDVKGRSSNEDSITFVGDSDLYIADLRYTWAPTGNPKNQEVTLQGEYFFRNEDGTYNDVAFDDNSNGWYAQAVYKFDPQWRVGYRYTELEAPSTPAGLIGTDLDSSGHDPYINSAMVDWTNSEFSRVRLQYNHDQTVAGTTDHQFIVQYIMSFGAHGAHKY